MYNILFFKILLKHYLILTTKEQFFELLSTHFLNVFFEKVNVHFCSI